VDPVARGRRGRMRPADWLRWRTRSRRVTPRHVGRSRHGEISQNGPHRPHPSQLRLDSTAFVAKLLIPANPEHQRRRARDAARARLELVYLMAEVDALASDLQAAKSACAARDYSTLPFLRRLRSGRRPAALDEEVQAAERRHARKHAELQATRARTEALEHDAREGAREGPGAVVYRLHSADHHMGCSSGRYAHLSLVQRAAPVCLTRMRGLRWWWFRDRFWWADAGLGPSEVESLVLDADLSGQYQREAVERARADLLGIDDLAAVNGAVADDVRREVWIRDRGRCVDCAIESGLVFDYVLPPAAGGSSTVANLELRCRPCQSRRRDNQAKAAIGKARVGAHASKEWGVELRDGGWPRPS
jgi:hypothetical protein